MTSAPHPVEDYLAKIPPWHAGNPLFMAMVAMSLQPFADAQAVAASLPAAFDLDTAIGVQLDKVGERVGRSRNVPIPIEGVFFSFGDASRGFGRGVWRNASFSGRVSINKLDDETYRKLLRAKIAANSWDGSIEGAQDVLDVFFNDPDTNVFIVDNARAVSPQAWFGFSQGAAGGFGAGRWRRNPEEDALAARAEMSISIGVSGKIPPLAYLFLLVQDLVAIKPGGVKVDYAVTSVNRAPVFGFGANNQFIGGFGRGSWPVSPEHLVDNPPT